MAPTAALPQLLQETRVTFRGFCSATVPRWQNTYVGAAYALRSFAQPRLVLHWIPSVASVTSKAACTVYLSANCTSASVTCKQYPPKLPVLDKHSCGALQHETIVYWMYTRRMVQKTRGSPVGIRFNGDTSLKSCARGFSGCSAAGHKVVIHPFCCRVSSVRCLMSGSSGL